MPERNVSDRKMSEKKIPEKRVIDAEVIRNEKIAEGIMKLTAAAPQEAAEARPGQFCNLYPASDRLILPRPVSICDADGEAGTLTFVYAVVGAGTEEFAEIGPGGLLRLSSPLGNGFRMPSEPGKTAVLIGGGVGTAPMVFLAKELKKRQVRCTAVTGFRREPFLSEELKAAGARVITTTDLPSPDYFLGTVVDCMEINEISGDCYFACGPKPMLAAVSEYTARRGQDVQVSLEERMGCGYGACVGCVCDIREKDGDGREQIRRRKVCRDGPVFMGSEVVWP